MLYTKTEAAKFLNVCIRTVDRATAAGLLNYRKIGGCIRFTQGDLNEFIRKSSVRPVTEEEERQKNGIWEVKNGHTHTA
jgi:excisionase family DNA binding protein